MSAAIAVMLLSHRLCDTTLARYDALRAALPAGDYDVVLTLTEPFGRAARGAGVADWVVLEPEEIFHPDYPLKPQSGKIVPGNPDLVTLALWRRRPHYRHIWYVEFDVFFAGGAGVLAEVDAASDADLILPRGGSNRKRSPNWMHWPSVVIPETETPPAEKQLQSMLCLHRVSARMLRELDAAYRRGWAGHFEGTMPTLATQTGLRVEQVNDIAKRTRGRRLIESDGFGALECRLFEADMIYHPLKTTASEALLLAGETVNARTP